MDPIRAQFMRNAMGRPQQTGPIGPNLPISGVLGAVDGQPPLGQPQPQGAGIGALQTLMGRRRG